MSAEDHPGSGKGHTDENFPVASALIAPRHRPLVLAFYRVARMGDDIADDPDLPATFKLAKLDSIASTLRGKHDAVDAAVVLRTALAARGLTPEHALDLLIAFRRDAIKSRYADWAELMDYCRYSAAPVGRFMLDVHGESRATWPASDALCAALQVINHLQDCGKDYREIDRVYVPQDALDAAGLDVGALGEERSSPALRGVIVSLTHRSQALLREARSLAGKTRDLRLALEIGVIQRLAESLAGRLLTRDPLSERVHHTKPEAAGVAVLGAGETLLDRVMAPRGARQARRAEA